MKTILKTLAVLAILLQCQMQLLAQGESSPILFIYDASGSMWGQMDGKTKKEIASDVLKAAVDNLPDGQQVGLMAYGHRKKEDCKDVEEIVDLKNTSKERVTNAVKGINPLGRTPLAYSATLAIEALRTSKNKSTIILVTDGIESCNGNICEVVSNAKLEGIEFKLHIVGFGLKEGEKEQLKCAADAGGGQYYDANDAEGLSEVLDDATTTTIDKPKENFSIYTTKNGSPVDSWVKAYKAGTKEAVDGSRTYRDSAYLYLPVGKYDINIKPLENTDISGTVIQVEIKEGETGHETVSFDGATLNIYTSNNDEGWDAVVKMYDKVSGKVASSTRTYGRTKAMEVNPGTYDVTIQALVIKGMATTHRMENVEIKAGETKTLSHNFETGIAMVGVKTAAGALIDATVNFTESSSGKAIAAGRTYTSENNNPKKFILSPGVYSVKIVTLGDHKGHTETFNISVKMGETVEKIISY